MAELLQADTLSLFEGAVGVTMTDFNWLGLVVRRSPAGFRQDSGVRFLGKELKQSIKVPRAPGVSEQWQNIWKLPEPSATITYIYM